MIVLKRILVATDFSEASDAALEYGRQLARQFDARLDVLHVAPDFTSTILAPQAYTSDFGRLQNDTVTAANMRLSELVSDEDRERLHAMPVVRTSDRPAAEILAYAEETGSDLILVGTQARGALANLLLGSVAERVVRLAHCSVLTVKHPQRDFVLPDALQRVTPQAT